MSIKREFLLDFRSEVHITVDAAVDVILKYGCLWSGDSKWISGVRFISRWMSRMTIFFNMGVYGTGVLSGFQK